MWEDTRNEPLRTFKWGVDSLLDVKFNPVLKDLLGMIHMMKNYIFIIFLCAHETPPIRFQLNYAYVYLCFMLNLILIFSLLC